MEQHKILNRLESYESQISSSNDTKSDVTYHKMKQSLHTMWSMVYDSEESDDRTSNIKKIQKCLGNLEDKVSQNEAKKYKQFYQGMGRSPKGCKSC